MTYLRVLGLIAVMGMVGVAYQLPHDMPMDVPAIQETHEIPEEFRESCGPMPYDPKTHSVLTICTPPETSRTVWTCADKSRILLTAEDGTKHCVKFK